MKAGSAARALLEALNDTGRKDVPVGYVTVQEYAVASGRSFGGANNFLRDLWRAGKIKRVAVKPGTKTIFAYGLT